MNTTIVDQRKKAEKALELNKRLLANRLLEKARIRRIEQFKQLAQQMQKAVKEKQFSKAKNLFKNTHKDTKQQRTNMRQKAISVMIKDEKMLKKLAEAFDKRDFTKISIRADKDKNFEIWQQNRNLQNSKTENKGLKAPKGLDLDAQRAWLLDKFAMKSDTERMQLLSPRKGLKK